ncbi:MAG TPA: hypothetical protein PKH07_13300, partial [bacterium]|nr:hypothetical protein [bacterium]
LLKTLAQEYPNEPEVLEQLGTLLTKCGEHREAFEILTKAAALYRQSSRFDSAATCYRDAMQSSNTQTADLTVKTWREFAEMYLTMGRFGEALGIFREAAESLLSLGLQDKIQEFLRGLADQNPQAGQAFESLADLFLEKGYAEHARWCLLQAAEFYASHQWFSKAQQIYETLVEKDPSLTEAATRLTQIYRQRGLDSEAATFCLHILQDSLVGKADAELRQFYLDLARQCQPESIAVLEASVGFHESALSLARGKKEQQAIGKELASLQCRLGERFLSENDFESAVCHLQAAMELDAKNPQVLALSEKIEKRRIERAPTEAAAEGIQKAEELVSKKKFADAAKLLETLLQSDPYNLRVTLDLCDVLVGQKKEDEAFSLMQEQGAHFVAENLLTSAQKCLERCCNLQPDEPESHLSLAGVLSRLGHREGAVKEYEKVLNLAEEKDLDELALNASRAALALEPDNLRFGQKQAMLLESSGETEQARLSWLTLSQRARERADEESRARFLQRALSVWPEDLQVEERIPVQQELAQSFVSLGRLEQAATLFDQSAHAARSVEQWNLLAKGLEFVLADDRISSSLRGRQGLEWLVEAYEKTKNADKAVGVWRQLARHLFEQGDCAGALKAYRSLLALQEGDLDALEQ